jgi:aminotransferase
VPGLDDEFGLLGARRQAKNDDARQTQEEEFSERLLMEEKVAVVPGSAFGASGAGHVRASYATSLPNIEEALNRIERFLSKVGSSIR